MYGIIKRIIDYYRHNRFYIWIVFAIATINVVRNIGVVVSENLAHGEEVEWRFYLINESTGSYYIALLIPFLIYFFRKYPLLKYQVDGPNGRVMQRILLYLLVTIIFGFTHTTLMYLTRIPLYHWANITRLHEIFNDLPYRYLMEYFKQFLSFWIIYIVFWAIEQYQAMKNKELQASKLSEDLMQSKLQTLQMQLHPHFFFNTLNAISSIMYRSPAQADSLISKLSSFLRKAIQLKNKSVHPLEDEMALLSEYRDIMLSRFEDRLSFIFEIGPDTLKANVPALLLQPLLENAVQYGMKSDERLVIELKTQRLKDKIQLTLADNGPGLQEGSLQLGIGLQNTFEKLKLCYGDKYSLEFHDSPSGGLLITIEIPWQ